MACLCSNISMEKSKFSMDMCWSDVCCRYFLHKSLGKNPGSWGFWSPRVERPNLPLFNKKMCALHPSFHHCTKKFEDSMGVESTREDVHRKSTVDSTSCRINHCFQMCLMNVFFLLSFFFSYLFSSLFLWYCTLRVQFDVPKVATSSNAASILFVLCWQWFGMAKNEWFLIATKPNT